MSISRTKSLSISPFLCVFVKSLSQNGCEVKSNVTLRNSSLSKTVRFCKLERFLPLFCLLNISRTSLSVQLVKEYTRISKYLILSCITSSNLLNFLFAISYSLPSIVTDSKFFDKAKTLFI